jgi:hypothetical protein
MLKQKFDSVDRLVCKYTALYTMEDLTDNVASTYQPTIQCISAANNQERQEMKAVADRYDTIMMVRGDKRRAKRF